ncbi:hypothetical protein I7I53_09226 [Histoplasma capsulatum var. duboisii H88]|uniref:Uncharacterized protein n=1 Tax=Ajellomyces capsulatus (strain H88) TaxID=544711 RepID=A0A8A1L975_AJEC8|nr:hypothetical protein I7I53_09226 [Histoplasma capsulatum var. duboisii H88]
MVKFLWVYQQMVVAESFSLFSKRHLPPVSQSTPCHQKRAVTHMKIQLSKVSNLGKCLGPKIEWANLYLSSLSTISDYPSNLLRRRFYAF